VAARTVLGPKPCSTQAPTVLNVRSFGSSMSCIPSWGWRTFQSRSPKSCRSYEAISMVNTCHGNAVLRGFVDGLGSMNDWQTRGSDWPPWPVSRPLQCRAVTEASKTMISVASC
jgi:hypothetical protein